MTSIIIIEKNIFLSQLYIPEKKKNILFLKDTRKKFTLKKSSKIILYSTFSIKKNNYIRYF